MVYIKWTCLNCRDIIISNTKRHHQMDICKCKKSGLDAEEYMTRMTGDYQFLESYDYNFFDELVLCMKEQELLEVMFIRKLEDEILESLK